MMSTIKEPLKLGFSSQKGGVGKSTFTALLASILHYRLGYNIAVIDCDFPQHSMIQMRSRDQKIVMENEYHKRTAHKQFSTLNKKAYSIYKCNAEQALEQAEMIIEQSPIPIDVIFFDLAGTVNTAGVLGTLVRLDHIFTPITADRVVLESTLGFSEVLAGFLADKREHKENNIHLFWNMVDGREKSSLYQSYESVISQLGLHMMKSIIPDSKKFRKEGEATGAYIFRSTLLPVEEKLIKTSKLDEFVKEFLMITHL